MKIGFVGLGIMGHPMALNLINGGHELSCTASGGCPPISAKPAPRSATP